MVGLRDATRSREQRSFIGIAGWRWKSGRGLPHSRTLARSQSSGVLRAIAGCPCVWCPLRGVLAYGHLGRIRLHQISARRGATVSTLVQPRLAGADKLTSGHGS